MHTTLEEPCTTLRLGETPVRFQGPCAMMGCFEGGYEAMCTFIGYLAYLMNIIRIYIFYLQKGIFDTLKLN